MNLRGRSLVAVTALLVLSACGGGVTARSSGVPATLADTSATVPMTIVSSGNATLALVRVMIDGHGPFVFALDSGASSSLVDTAVAEQVGLVPEGTQTITGVTCTTDARRVSLSRWSVSGVPLPSVTATVTNLAAGNSRLRGLLGSDVLSRFGAITVDYAQGLLELGEAAVASAGPASTIPLTVVRGQGGATLALVPVRIDGHGPYTFAVDTGASTSVLDVTVARQIGLPLHDTDKVVTGVACSTDVQQTTLGNWRIGRRSLPASRVDVVQFPRSGGGRLQGLLGSNVLAAFGQVTVDYAHAELRIPNRNG